MSLSQSPFPEELLAKNAVNQPERQAPPMVQILDLTRQIEPQIPESFAETCRLLNLDDEACQSAYYNSTSLDDIVKTFIATQLSGHENYCRTQACHTLYGVVLPSISCLSLLASAIVICVLLRMRSTAINVLLLVLFTSEICKVVASTIVYLPFAYCRHATGVCKTVMKCLPFLHPIAQTAHTLTECTCITITMDRYQVVSHPLRIYHFTRKRVLRICGGALCLAVTVSVPTMFEIRYVEECGCVRPTTLRTSQTYVVLYYLAFRSFIGFCGVGFVLVLLNAMLLKRLRKSSQTNPELSIPARLRERRTVTLTCTSVVLCFVATNFIPSLNNILEAIGSGKSNTAKLLVYLGNASVVVGPFLNSLVYCGLGSAFRTAMKDHHHQLHTQYYNSHHRSNRSDFTLSRTHGSISHQEHISRYSDSPMAMRSHRQRYASNVRRSELIPVVRHNSIPSMISRKSGLRSVKSNTRIGYAPDRHGQRTSYEMLISMNRGLPLKNAPLADAARLQYS